MGINIFIGNHKAYLHGHPKYDIDTFFKGESFDKIEPGINHLTEAQRNNFFVKEGFFAIRSDLPAFIYRSILKSVWHWFNIEKIPNYPAPDTYLTDDGTKIKIGDIFIFQSLIYTIYKLLYIPLFIASLCLMFTGKLKREYSVFFIPYVVLWPIVVITFPDTRFKISAEVLALMPMVESLKLFFNNWKITGSLNDGE